MTSKPTDSMQAPSGAASRPNAPWTRIFLAASIGAPALIIGGVPPVTVPLFCVAIGLLWNRVCRRSDESLRVPWVACLGVFATLITLLQWVPMMGLAQLLAPGMRSQIEQAMQGTGVDPWSGLSPTPGDTALETARLMALTGLCVAAAQLSWRVTATVVAAIGTMVALIGLTQDALGIDAIFGVYHARDADLSQIPALLGTFVNPNHQSGLLLLGIFCAAAMAADQHAQGLRTRDASKVDRYGDRFLAAMAALAIQIPALVLSLSRGALIVFLIAAPFAVWLGLRAQQTDSRGRRRRLRRLSSTHAVVLIGFAGLFMLVAQDGAWRELGTLLRWHEDPSAAQKLHAPFEALPLVSQSPIVGIGRGAFVDMFGAIDPQPSHILATHLECIPVAAIIEWGPVPAAVVLIGLTVWWTAAFWHGGHREDTAPRRIALLGVLALALQNLGDFSLNFLGVTAPAAALAGALSAPKWLRWSPRSARPSGLLALAAAAILGAWSLPYAWANREPKNTAIMQQASYDVETELRMRPLDGRLHGLLARRAAQDGRWDRALARATAATRLRPGSIDAWLLRSSAERQHGDRAASHDSLRTALALLHEPPTDPLLAFILGQYPTAEALAEVAPTREPAWRLLATALLERAPQLADGVAAKRQANAPLDPEPLRLRADIALRQHNPALALHHARQLLQLAPDDAGAYVLASQACLGFAKPRFGPARDVLEAGLQRRTIVDAAERGVLETHLLEALLGLGDEDALARAREIAPLVLSRPATRAQRRHREALVRRVSPSYDFP